MYKSNNKKTSLKWSFLPYMLFMFLLALLGTFVIGISINVAQDIFADIYSTKEALFEREAAYGENGEAIYGYTEDGAQMYNEDGEPLFSVVMGYKRNWQSPWYSSVYNFIGVSQYLFSGFWIIACLLFPGLAFYRSKLKKPLAVLMNASEKISQNDLDFHVDYQSQNEMGILCQSFERMRRELLKSQLEMWRQMEERRRLNAAFSHDLRTPLTVLKGQSEMLIKYIPEGKIKEEKLLNTLDTMHSHILRLENYTETMNHLQKLEDIVIHKEAVLAGELARLLRENADILPDNQAFALNTKELTMKILWLDMDKVLQVFNNLLSNASRFASHSVDVALSCTKEMLFLTVYDDGGGFAQDALEKAAEAFYSTDKASGSHFGMGLNICKILCEKHGGFLKLYNTGQGAAAEAAFSILKPDLTDADENV